MEYRIEPQMENRTLYVGNLENQVTEDLICMLFGQLGEVRGCKMFREPSSDPYCFVEYANHMSAINAIAMMNDKNLQGRKMRVDWATGQATKSKYTKVDTSNHFHIYVGDLSPEIDEQALKEAFQVFGEISDCKIVKDPQSFKSRGYGFVVFVKKMDAETAISNMNGQWLGRKMIKARWATRKPNNNPDKMDFNKKMNYDDIFNQTTPTNTTVFCGGLKSDVTEETLSASFDPYGPIEKIKIFKDKGYAFIKYATKENATDAIVDMHNTTINGQVVRCSWGKDTGPDGPAETSVSPAPSTTNGVQPPAPQGPQVQQTPQAPQAPQGPTSPQGGQMGYWPCYPQNQMYQPMYPYNYGYQHQPIYNWMGWGQPQGWQAQGAQQPNAPPTQPPQ